MPPAICLTGSLLLSKSYDYYVILTIYECYRRVFQIEQGYPVMTAARNLEESLAKHHLPASDDFYLLLATEELVRLDRAFKQTWLATHGDRIRRERVDGSAPEVCQLLTCWLECGGLRDSNTVVIIAVRVDD
jgi:hypothetical protein